jgi:hypothetical protein
MLAHEKMKPGSDNHEKMFDFVIKAVPSSLKELKPEVLKTTVETDYGNNSYSSWKYVQFGNNNNSPLRFASKTETDSCAANRSARSMKSMKSETKYQKRRDDQRLLSKLTSDDDDESMKSFCSMKTAKAYATVSKETRKIDTVKREHQISSEAHVLCFSFVFVYDAESFESERLSVVEIIYRTKECVICLENDSTVKLECNHQCICSTCYTGYIKNVEEPKCPLCRQIIIQ